MSNELLTLEQVAERLSVCVETVRRWVRSGRLPAVRIGKAYRVSSDTLAAWLRERETSR